MMMIHIASVRSRLGFFLTNRSRSKKKGTKLRVWEIRVDSILKLDRAEKAAPEEQENAEFNPEEEAA